MPGNCPAWLRPICGSPVENIPLQAERHSGRGQKLFAFPPESRSPSDRNAVRNHNGMVFSFRPESRSPSTGFPNNRISTELGSLFQEQLAALQASATVHLTAEGVRDYDKRRRRICEICEELAKSKGFGRVIQKRTSS
jgi:hypothetical protein